MLTLTIFTQKRWEVWLKCLYRFNGYHNVFRGTENIFCDITYFPHKCATFVVPFVFWYTKMLTLTIFTQKRWEVWLKCLYRFKGYHNVFRGTEKDFLWYYVFSSQMCHLCGSLCILVYKNADVDNFVYLKSQCWGVWYKIFIQIFYSKTLRLYR